MTATLDHPTTTTTVTADAADEVRGSAYPADVADLLPRARALVDELGERPSRRRVMTELRVGAPKAARVLAALDEHDIAPATRAAAASVPVLIERPAPVPAPSVTTTPTDTLDGHDTSSADVDVDERQAVDEQPSTAPAAGPVRAGRRMRAWPVLLLALPAFVAIWSGWVGLGGLTGFGVVRPLPGIWDSLAINTAVTLPIGMEAYAAFALRAWLSTGTPVRARRFARTSAVAALVIGAAGQVAYHLMTAAGITSAPWPITALVACLPVAVLGMGAALAHLLADHDGQQGDEGRTVGAVA